MDDAGRHASEKRAGDATVASGPDDDEVGVPALGDRRDLLGCVALEDLEIGLDSGLLGHRSRGVQCCAGSVQVLADLVVVDGAT